MGVLKWYKRDPRAALAGMMELSLEERGAYNTILDLIYVHDGKVLDDGRLLANWLGVEVRAWKRIRKRLIERNKIYILGGHIHNEKADDETAKALKRLQDASLAGLTSAKVRGYGIRKINGLQTTTVKRTLELTTATKISLLRANTVPSLSKRTSDEEKK